MKFLLICILFFCTQFFVQEGAGAKEASRIKMGSEKPLVIDVEKNKQKPPASPKQRYTSES